jgi:hypothetical protein
MTSATPTRTTSNDVRLSLKTTAPTSGFVDGAWWPRSRDLAAELPALLGALEKDLGRVERISYNLTTWGATVRKLQVDGAAVHLAGYHTQAADTIDVIGAGKLLTLLVVPPEATEPTAAHALRTAAETGNIDAVATLLGR